jgi:hypothetical protein
MSREIQTQTNPFDGLTFIVEEDADDFTFYLDAESNNELADRLLRLRGAKKGELNYSFCGEVNFQHGDTRERGRGLICLSHAGRYLSVTVRKLTDESGYEASSYSAGREPKRLQDLFSIEEYCDLLYEQIFLRTNSSKNAHGLLVITGATNSAKSKITRGLISRYLQNKPAGTRLPHLVTFEDPIERLYSKETNSGTLATAVVMNGRKVNYTPREKLKDGGTLKRALEDALRQTPAVLFVGETRRQDEWRLLLDFAATGHLIVTTAHAGSLVEAMHRIFEARNVKSPADRNEIASKLLGLVHLGSADLEVLPVPFEPADFVDSLELAGDGTPAPGSPPIKSGFVRGDSLLNARRAGGSAEELVKGFNRLLMDTSLHREIVFKPFRESEDFKPLIKKHRADRQLQLLNRSLLEAHYPRVITKRRRGPRMLFPALWRRTSRGVAGLTSDGLASLLPHRPDESRSDIPSCVGRRWCVEQLLKQKSKLKAVFDELELKNLRRQISRNAIEWDLQGI